MLGTDDADDNLMWSEHTRHIEDFMGEDSIASGASSASACLGQRSMPAPPTTVTMVKGRALALATASGQHALEGTSTCQLNHCNPLPRQSIPSGPLQGGRRVGAACLPTPKISVLTVVRNGERTLRRAIDSVIGQLGDDIEYVIVDGASTDGTVDIITQYADQLAYRLSEPDHGIYDAMNKALAVARGDWVIFLGADDELKPSLQTVARELSNPQAVYYGNVEITATGKISGGRFNRYRLMQENICHQAILYPRSVYQTKQYDTDAGMLADHKYNIELWGSGTRFIHLPRVISWFNDVGASSGNQAYFETIKLATIRSSFGLLFYALKLVRTAVVHLVKGRRESA